uniref:Transducer of regulated CREB activity N-terminal domain-containing protein n=1 Tax=Glossina brevipalpis TaxID=37001 RepID=A0A1A9WPZ1_9MUSC
MANPRKFSEKIALQKQKQAEGTAEFEKIMNEVKATRVLENNLNNSDNADLNATIPRIPSCSSGSNSGASGGGASPDTVTAGSGCISSGGSPTPTYRESRGRSVGVGPMRRPSERKQDRSPYGSTNSGITMGGMPPSNQKSYLSPPIDSSWRRSNSDSALHQTLNLAEGDYGPAVVIANMEMNSLHANYQHHHHQRSHSPHVGRSFSPQAQRRKNALMQQQQQAQQQQTNHQQQQQLHQQRLQIQHQQAQQQQHQMQQHLHQQHHHQLQQLQPQQQQQQQLHSQQTSYNAKFPNANNIPANVMFKSLQEQQLNFANTGSLPDLTSVHYGGAVPAANQPMMPATQQQQNLTPILSSHNNGCQHERDQSPSPFSPSNGGGGGAAPQSPYRQQQNSPTSAANTPTANAQTSPHLSFTNLSVQSPTANSVAQSTTQPAVSTAAVYSTLPTLGATNPTNNMTDYRQPLNPPSPGSSPGLLTSGTTTNELNASAPPSPIRHPQSAANLNNGQLQNTGVPNTFGTLDSSSPYNSLNPAFHNHFEQFHLGDSSQSPQNNYEALDFEDFVVSGSTGSQQTPNFTNKLLDFGDLTPTATSRNSPVNCNDNSTTACSNNNNNNNLSGAQNQQQMQQQQHLNNNAVISATNSSSGNSTNVNGLTTCHSLGGMVNNNDSSNPNLRQDILSTASSPISSPLNHCVPSPSSPLPIPISAHSPHHQLSLSVQTSPHHSPLHSPQNAPSPLSVSSPGLTMLGCGNISPVPSSTNHIMATNHLNNQNQQLNQQQSTQIQQQQNQTNTPTTTTNIPQIIFSDYSSSRDIFDHLDLDLGQIDEPGLQMLSDQNPIMIADPSIEDSFRRDLN